MIKTNTSFSWNSLDWHEPKNYWNELWRLPMAQRVKTFGWLLLKGRLLTNSERYRRKMTDDPTCQLCNGNIEDIDHVFKLCPLAVSTWEKILPADMKSAFLSSDIISWLQQSLLTALPSSWKVGFLVTCWKLWAARNNRIFNATFTTEDCLFHQIRATVKHTTSAFFFLNTFL